MKSMLINAHKKQLAMLLLLAALLVCSQNVAAQDGKNYLRIARIVVDSTKLEAYKTALKEGMAAAVKLEPGVISLHAMFDKKKPTNITVFENYASMEAYNLHIQTPHFKKYKAAVAGMVRSLELVDVDTIAEETKKKL